MIRRALLAIFILLSTTNSAMAYIDPGIGALFVQGLIGVIAGFSLFFSRVRDSLRRVLGMTKDNPNSEFSPESKEQSEKSSKHKQS